MAHRPRSRRRGSRCGVPRGTSFCCARASGQVGRGHARCDGAGRRTVSHRRRAVHIGNCLVDAGRSVLSASSARFTTLLRVELRGESSQWQKKTAFATGGVTDVERASLGGSGDASPPPRGPKTRGRIQPKGSSRLGWAAVAIVVVVVVVLIVGEDQRVEQPIVAERERSQSRACAADLVQAITRCLPRRSTTWHRVPPVPFSVTKGQSLLSAKTSDGTVPRFGLLGGEFCPHCAVMRWALISALSRFGTFSTEDHELRAERRQHPDVFVSRLELLEQIPGVHAV